MFFYGLTAVKTCKVGVLEKRITDWNYKVSGKLKLLDCRYNHRNNYLHFYFIFYLNIILVKKKTNVTFLYIKIIAHIILTYNFIQLLVKSLQK
jgi:hypothetical protein